MFTCSPARPWAGVTESHLNWIQSRGADPSIRTENFEPYLSPGRKLPIEVANEDGDTRNKLEVLEQLYAGTPKAKEPHPDIGCWWTLYDYGLDAVKTWAKEYKRVYPGEQIGSPHSQEAIPTSVF